MVQFLGWEDFLEKSMITYSSIFACGIFCEDRIPPSICIHSIVLHRAGHHWSNSMHIITSQPHLVNQNRKHYNQHIFVNEKCLFIPIKICASDSMNPLKVFSASCWLWKLFLPIKVLELLKQFQSVVERSQWLWRLINCSTLEVLVGDIWIWHCHGEMDPYCWPMLAAVIATFQCILLICWAYLIYWFYFEFRNLYWIRLTADQQHRPWPAFVCVLSFGKRLRASS